MKKNIQDMCFCAMLGLFPLMILIEIFGIKISLIIIALTVLLFIVLYAVVYLICRCIYQYVKAVKGNEVILSFRNPITIKWRAPIVIKQIK